MIRRDAGHEFWLITQEDHAALSGRLAARVGTTGKTRDRFDPPAPRDVVVTAISAHDAGWREADAAAALNAAGLPLHFTEQAPDVALRLWTDSARRAAVVGPYAGLLVSLHGMALSALAAGRLAPREQARALRSQFELNRFQNNMIELQETLRVRLGLSVDKPLRLGLCDGWTDPAEDALRAHFRLLQALDLLSLSVCCTTPPETQSGPVHARAGDAPIRWRIERPRADRLLISPWPFDAQVIEEQFDYRAVAALPARSRAEFAKAYAGAETRTFRFAVCPG